MPSAPPVDGSDVVAFGADLEPGTLLAAYRVGLFPMPSEHHRIAWFSPDPRGILPLDGLRISRSLRRSVKRYEVTINTAFQQVITACADPTREGRWITDDFIDAYSVLHTFGWAHSFEVWADDDLIGGLYGVRIGGLFAGESMFHRATDASKVALVHLVDWLNTTGASLLDVQWTTDHLVSLGAIEISRSDYLKRLGDALARNAPPAPNRR
ncbi:MAG: leucyl/phenylalanyl-tRNA--protein transferase [Ilumatobacter coccineus]|uniref:Leucyl/phenylalanyl-tRNA--protein transferase n=1 Tax=Ilumatobacter coccineus TaxID=467094 RepID=A0A2G6K9F5_9ACTN|nr:MAG: leucyl/phenylalanyl-tRNA--protein transferase [Ilumatobacter coccineus]